MPSPFPGMDPFIESSDRWSSFHIGMVVAISGQLNARLPERFVGSASEYILVQEPARPNRRRDRQPDVYVSKRERQIGSAERAAVATASATMMLPAVEPRRRRYVEVVDRDLRQVVTVIELLSPANKKAGDDRDAYLRKRKEYRAGGLSLVEVDLLRGGRRLPLGTPHPEVRDYYIMVCCSWEHGRADLWTFGMRDPFPLFPIPLTDDTPPAVLDLKPCLDRVYNDARYATELHYDMPLAPRPDKRDAAWVHEILAGRSG